MLSHRRLTNYEVCVKHNMLIPNPEKSMEDVWKDLSFFADHPTPKASTRSSNFGDFLSLETDPTPTLGALPLDSDQLKKKKRDRLENGDDDTRYKMRMVKNRESAARSRARKQAYTYELELEIAHFKKENAKLRKQLQNKDFFLPKEASAVQAPQKQSLQRTLTAPF